MKKISIGQVKIIEKDKKFGYWTLLLCGTPKDFRGTQNQSQEMNVQTEGKVS